MKEQIQKDYIEAFKAKETLKKDVLGLLKGAIQNAEINKKEELSDEEIIDIVNKQIKLRKDGIVEFEKAGRDNLVSQYQEEIDVLTKYMPEELTPEEVDSIIDEVINAVKPDGMKDFGKIMKELTPRLKGRTDISKVSGLVKEKL
ncbi:MAG: GatB/YqeY domain-containing protein [Bacilli bacterium]|nr:GatB/YqeY domain-containing protein [Bacilli bacterium]